MPEIVHNSRIHGLVNRGSSIQAKHREPIGERASSKLLIKVLLGLHAATKPKARSPMGFLLCAAKTGCFDGCGESLRSITAVTGNAASGLRQANGANIHILQNNLRLARRAKVMGLHGLHVRKHGLSFWNQKQ